jgi:hypothetical protein
MENKRGLYLMRYNTTDLKIFRVADKKNNISCLEFCPDREHRWGKVGFKFGRTSNIENRLKYFKKEFGIEYNLIKFFPCSNEKHREELLKNELYSELGGLGKDWVRNHSGGAKPEHISLRDTHLKWMFYLVHKYSTGKIIKDYKRFGNYYVVDKKTKKELEYYE